MHSRRKPAWVQREILRHAALQPEASCRLLAAAFNRRHAGRDGATVGKSYVHALLRRQRCEIMRLRRALRHRRYEPGEKNCVWGIDGTGKTDAEGRLHFILGLLDHGTRRCLSLQALTDKASITLLRVLLNAIEHYGKPRSVRTDHEAIFQSRLFRLGLAWLGIRHQTTERHCPWQNGRIERFFGTLKSKLDRWSVADRHQLNAALVSFRLWHNHVRPHQHLQGRTPAEVWDGIDIYQHRVRRRLGFEAWDGLLQGEYLQL